MRINKIILCTLMVIFLAGCGKKDEISYSSVVCEYSTTPTYGMRTEFFSFNIRVNADNTVEVYCGDFDDEVAGKEIKVDYLYGKTYEITEEQKQEIIDVIKKNRVYYLDDCSTLSCDGSYSYLYLFDENGEVVHSCGGLNPSKKRFVKTENALFDLIPDDAYSTITDESQRILEEYLIENYPEEYSFLID